MSHDSMSWQRPDAVAPSLADESALLEQVLYEVKKVVVGQDHFLERILVALLAQGHLLIEGVPGLAKTRLIPASTTPQKGSLRTVGSSSITTATSPVRPVDRALAARFGR